MMNRDSVSAIEQHETLTDRGHEWLHLGRKMIVCKKCKQKKAKRGGCDDPCQVDDKRRFLGGTP